MVTIVIEGAVAADTDEMVSGGRVPGTKTVSEAVSEDVSVSVSVSAGTVVIVSETEDMASVSDWLSEKLTVSADDKDMEEVSGTLETIGSV